MSKFIGRRVEAAIAIEDTRGVGKAPTFSMGKIDFSLYDKTVDVRDDSGIGRIEDSNDKFVVEKYAMGSMSGILGANNALYLLGLAFGQLPTVSTVADSRYPWTLGLANTNQHLTASLLVKDGNETRLHKMLMLNSLELSVEQEDAIRWTAEFVCKRGVTSTQSIPTYIDDYKFTKRKNKIYLASAVGSLSAATRLALKSFKLNINKNVVRDSAIGTVEPIDILNQQMTVEGELKLNYEDQTYRNLMLQGTYRALRIVAESEKLIGVSSYGDLTLDFSKVDFFGWEPDGPNDEIVQNTINFKANYDLTTSAMLNAGTVRNSRATL